ncbi:MAG TPA: ketopantoate reductase family protein [Chloroflexota bacterium]|nr:ketopantoate reductase family protein [Chloroflexota bacterium]
MRVLVVGAGSLGTVVAAALAASGCDVTLYCRPAQVAPIRAEGLTLSGVRDVRARVQATASAGEIGPVDYLLLAVKTRDTEAALAAVRDVPVGAAASLQNGLAKDDQLVACFGRERVLGAATILGATASGPGRATWTMAGMSYFGELDGPPTPRVEALVAAFNAAGLPAEAVADVRAVEWSKLCQIVPAAALSALTRLEYYKVCKQPGLAGLFVDLTRECAAVAAADGVQIGDYQGFNPHTLVTLPRAEAVATVIGRGQAMEAQGLTEMRISMLQDLLRGRPTEVEETLGYVVRRAAARAVPAPLTHFAYGVIRGVEAYL